MLLKIGKMTLRCPKRLHGNEYTGQSQTPVVNTPGILDSPVMNLLGRRLCSVFGTSIQTGLQKKLLVKKDLGVTTPSVLIIGESDSLMYFAPAAFFVNQFRPTSRGIITRES
jgi:hypothetical protein